MNTAETLVAIPPEIRAELERTLADADAGIRYAAKMKAAAERMDRIREANRLRSGDADVGVEIIREMRNRS